MHLLAQDTRNKMITARGKATGVDSELNRYIGLQKTADVMTDNWSSVLEGTRTLLAPLAEDFVSAPASQAYVERAFSACGDLCCRIN